jgi:hypothetical protein
MTGKDWIPAFAGMTAIKETRCVLDKVHELANPPEGIGEILIP